LNIQQKSFQRILLMFFLVLYSLCHLVFVGNKIQAMILKIL
jgi:hypothetical protein